MAKPQITADGRTLAKDMLAGMKAIRRWCDVNDHHTDNADKVRNIRLVAAEYLSRAGVADGWAPRERKPPSELVGNVDNKPDSDQGILLPLPGKNDS